MVNVAVLCLLPPVAESPRLLLACCSCGKVTFSAYQAVAEWKWDLPEDSDDTCGICRVEFEGTCSKCKYPGDDCPISMLMFPANLQPTNKQNGVS
ncbi:hypothetical protein D0867_08988 [Hortaea werneckii]|uniref:Anaphase-promoting complex subunit 11 RING-H2 finger domain-containing protein n=1 Tax=Hortaea werneckii TaxID=91943 RepID=A0A3M6Z079_HORWE|nr:hypothetical protein D0867_08988 [Hortaea werneckii]